MSVSIPNTIEYIGENAFTSCDNLTSVEIPDSVKTIANSSFNQCINLTTVTLGNSVELIDGFCDCDKIETITITTTTPPTLKSEGFRNVDLLNAIYVPAESMETYKNADGWKNFADKIQAIA